MGARLLSAATILAAFLSAGVLGLMLAAPLLPQPATGGASPGASAMAEPSASAGMGLPPIGVYLQRGPVSFGSGPCLAVELTPRSYPLAEGAEGTATIRWWDRGIVDPGHPDTCATRAGDLHVIEASVSRVFAGDDPDGRLIGYEITFPIAMEFEGHLTFDFTILLSRSTQEVLQAVVTNPQSTPGLVFDRVEEIDPPLASMAPAPSSEAGSGSVGLYLLEGPLTAEGACLAIELTPESYSPYPGALGAATIRWWESGASDRSDPAACLSRIGDIHEVAASVVAVLNADVPTYVVRFAAPLPGTDASAATEFAILADESDHDRLVAVRETTSGTERLLFDRVDTLDPPLVPAPSATSGAP